MKRKEKLAEYRGSNPEQLELSLRELEETKCGECNSQ